LVGARHYRNGDLSRRHEKHRDARSTGNGFRNAAQNNPGKTAPAVHYQDTVLGALHMKLQKDEVADMSTIPQTFADQFGWRELARAVERATATLSAAEREHAAVYTQNYGEAGAMDFFGRDVPPAVSGHNNYWLWGSHGATTYIVVGDRIVDHRRAFADVRAIETLRTPYAIPYENVTIFVARGMRIAPEVLWPLVRHYD